MDEIAHKIAERLERAALNPEWDKARKTHDWRNHVPENVQAMWSTFTMEQRMALVEWAESLASGNVERVFVYEWSGDLQEGLAAARKGQLNPIMHHSHREVPRGPPPEAPVRLSPKSLEIVREIIKKIPRIARRF